MSHFGTTIVLDCKENLDCKIQDVNSWDPNYTIIYVNVFLCAFGFFADLLW